MNLITRRILWVASLPIGLLAVLLLLAIMLVFALIGAVCGVLGAAITSLLSLPSEWLSDFPKADDFEDVQESSPVELEPAPYQAAFSGQLVRESVNKSIINIDGIHVAVTCTDAFGKFIVRGVGAKQHIFGSGVSVTQAKQDFITAYRHIILAPSSLSPSKVN